MAAAPELMIIGLDGATFDILDPLMDRGVMPTLAALMRQGTRGTLRSVIPTNSMAAWASFMTGRTPGRHGVYEFRMPVNNDPARKRVVTSGALRAESLWSLLSRHGKRVGVINVPLTYPPTPVNGFMVSGIIVPGGSRSFTYPRELLDGLTTAVGEYTITVPWQTYGGAADAFLRDLQRATENRLAATLYLLDRYPVNVFMVVFVGPDRLQHCMWRYMDPEHPEYNEGEAARYRPALDAYWSLLDRALAELLGRADERTTVLVHSDHGFQSNNWQFSLNEWLAERGLLHFTSSVGRQTVHALKRLSVQMRWVRRMRRWYRHTAPTGIRPGSPESEIDWARTRAFCAWAHQEGVWINLRGRQPQGTVAPGPEYESLKAEIRQALLALRNPATGAPAVAEVLNREDVYTGPYSDAAPDLLLVPGRHMRAAPPSHPGLGFQPTGWASGGHHLDGMLVAHGPAVRRGAVLAGARLWDLAPTALYLLDLPVQQDMDGRVLTDMLAPDFVAARPVRVEAGGAADGPAADGFTEQEEEDVKAQLRGLGYLS